MINGKLNRQLIKASLAEEVSAIQPDKLWHGIEQSVLLHNRKSPNRASFNWRRRFSAALAPGLTLVFIGLLMLGPVTTAVHPSGEELISKALAAMAGNVLHEKVALEVTDSGKIANQVESWIDPETGEYKTLQKFLDGRENIIAVGKKVGDGIFHNVLYSGETNQYLDWEDNLGEGAKLPFITWPERLKQSLKYGKAENLGEDIVEGQGVDVVRITFEEGQVDTYYLSKASRLPLKTVFEQEVVKDGKEHSIKSTATWKLAESLERVSLPFDLFDFKPPADAVKNPQLGEELYGL